MSKCVYVSLRVGGGGMVLVQWLVTKLQENNYNS